jgi:hypothetical protein
MCGQYLDPSNGWGSVLRRNCGQPQSHWTPFPKSKTFLHIHQCLADQWQVVQLDILGGNWKSDDLSLVPLFQTHMIGQSRKRNAINFPHSTCQNHGNRDVNFRSPRPCRSSGVSQTKFVCVCEAKVCPCLSLSDATIHLYYPKWQNLSKIESWCATVAPP